MLRIVTLAAPFLVLSALPAAAEGAKATFSVTATIIPAESLDTGEAELTPVSQSLADGSSGAPLLSPAPEPKLDTTQASLDSPAGTQ